MENSGMAPHEDEKAMDGLLRRKLARGADSAGVCPEPDILAAYFERSLDADEIARHELHFSHCPRCREQLAAMARANAPAGVGAGSSPASSLRFWLWDWRWLAVPAAAMLAFAIVGFLHERSAKEMARLTNASPTVALTQPETQPGENLVLRPDEKKPEARLTAPAQKSTRAFSNAGPMRALPPSGRAVLAPKLSAESARDEKSAPKAAPEDKLTAALAKGEVRQQPLRTSARADDAPRSTNETVEVTAAAPAVTPAPAPLSPPATANVAGGVGGGAGVDSAGEPPTSDGANVANAKELDATAARKKSKQSLDAGAAQAEISSSMNYSAAQTVTVLGERSSQMILTPDPQILWRFAGSGFVERSTDGGATWQGEEPTTGAQMIAGVAPSTTVCWIVGRDGLILLTKDAKSWKKIPPPVNTDFVAVSAESAPSATVTTADGRKFATKDGGKKWKPAESAATPPQN
jgi:Photosynthesis system II assembly factor YCF48